MAVAEPHLGGAAAVAVAAKAKAKAKAKAEAEATDEEKGMEEEETAVEEEKPVEGEMGKAISMAAGAMTATPMGMGVGGGAAFGVAAAAAAATAEASTGTLVFGRLLLRWARRRVALPSRRRARLPPCPCRPPPRRGEDGGSDRRGVRRSLTARSPSACQSFAPTAAGAQCRGTSARRAAVAVGRGVEVLRTSSKFSSSIDASDGTCRRAAGSRRGGGRRGRRGGEARRPRGPPPQA